MREVDEPVRYGGNMGFLIKSKIFAINFNDPQLLDISIDGGLHVRTIVLTKSRSCTKGSGNQCLGAHADDPLQISIK